jgi:hypothetical protein
MAGEAGGRPKSEWQIRADDAATAVIAHGLLNSLSVVMGTILTLRENGHRLSRDAQDGLLARAQDQCELITGTLLDFARGFPPELIAALDTLNESGGCRPEA